MPAVQLARAAGMAVIGTAGTPEGLKQVLQNGAHYAFNHREENYTKNIMVTTHPIIVNILTCINNFIGHNQQRRC